MLGKALRAAWVVGTHAPLLDMQGALCPLAKGRELEVTGSGRGRKGRALEAAQAAAPKRRQQ